MRTLLSGGLCALLLTCTGCYGLVSTADHSKSALAAQSLGATLVRVEFDVCDPATSIDSTIALFQNNGAKVLLLAGMDEYPDGIPSTACAQNVGQWAYRFGPGGTYWTTHTGGGTFAVDQIEFGNETSGRNGVVQDDWWNSSQYHTRAQNYAHRFMAARNAMNFAGHQDVGLLCQADDGGSANPAWVDYMYVGEPNLTSNVAGWVVHPYGPQSRWEPKLDRLIAYTGAHGGSSVPIEITEYGLATDNGNNLNDNYGWPTNLSYATAAADLDSAANGISNKLGSRLDKFMLYSAHDLAPSGNGQRESYFGALKDNLSDKGAFSTEYRDLLDNN